MAKPYLEHLLAFSDHIFADGRLQLIQRLSDEELLTLIRDGLGRTSRKAREMLSVNLLDLINTEPRTSELLVGNNFRQPIQSAPAPTPNAHDLATSGMASRRGQPKRKATENADHFGVRLHTAAALNTTNEGISNSISGEQEDNGDWAGMTAEHDHDLQDETPADANTDINVVNVWSTACAIPKLKIGAWVMNISEMEEWQPLGDVASGNSIAARFLTDFTSDQAKHAAYAGVARNAALYIAGGKCINILVLQNGCGRMAFENARANTHRACDTCIRTRRLCVRVVHCRLGTKLCVYPLPEACRESKALGSIAAWVIGG